jgi:hypothetical protein
VTITTSSPSTRYRPASSYRVGRPGRLDHLRAGLPGRVRSRKFDLEVSGEFGHIGPVLGVGFVSQVRCDLAFNRAAADGKAGDAAGRRRGVMPSHDAVKLDLVTASVGSRLNGMEIDACSVRVTERQGGGQSVSFQPETAALEEAAARGDGVSPDDKVKIIVLSCLPPQQRVDTPAPVDPGVHPCGLKLAEHG